MNGSLFGSNSSNIESLELESNEMDTDSSVLDTIIPPITDPNNISNNNDINQKVQESINTIDSTNVTQESIIVDKGDVFQSKLNSESINNEDLNTNVGQENIEIVEDDNRSQFYVFKCRDCSAMFGKYGLAENNSCASCGSINVDMIDGNIDQVPYIIPFNYSLDDAINNYKKYVKFNPLIPGIFKCKKTLSSISKVFVVSELFDINLAGDVSFFAGDKNINDGKEELKKYDVKNTVNFDFKDVLMCGSSKISMPIFLGISNYDFQQIKQYDSSLILDCNVLFSDLSPMDISNFASNMVMDYSLGIIKKNVNHQLKKVNKNNIGVNFSNSKSVLVPLYLLNVSYKGHIYTYIMNGCTGKTTMKVTYGKKEIIILSVILFILIFAISLLFVYLV